jgi:hypothetical protein
MHGTEMITAVLIPLGFFAMVFGIVYMAKRENLAMIEKGINPKERHYRPAPFVSLKWGLLLVGAGAGLLVAYLLDFYLLAVRDQWGYHHHDSPAIYFALIAIGGGLGLIASYKIEKKELLDKKHD